MRHEENTLLEWSPSELSLLASYGSEEVHDSVFTPKRESLGISLISVGHSMRRCMYGLSIANAFFPSTFYTPKFLFATIQEERSKRRSLCLCCDKNAEWECLCYSTRLWRRRYRFLEQCSHNDCTWWIQWILQTHLLSEGRGQLSDP